MNIDRIIRAFSPLFLAASWRYGARVLFVVPFLAAVLFLAGCKVGPDYHRPAPLGTNAMPSAFAGAGTNAGEWKPAEPKASFPRGAWWQVFGDPDLNRLMLLAETNNQQLKAAVARFAEAQATVRITRAGLLPQLNFDPSYTRQRTSYNAPQNGKPAKAIYNYDTFSVPLEASWEIDLWGRVRRQVESARASLAASADDLSALELSIQAELATDYFTLRDVDAEYAVVERTAEAYRRSLELTLNRRKGGVVGDLDVSQAETQLRSTEASVPPLRLQRLQLLHALATLCGQPATGFDLLASPGTLAPAPIVPVSLPSELLERRPDVAAAEQLMTSANAQIGVAKGAFYPSVQVTGLSGFQSISASSLFRGPSSYWSVGPSVTLPLFTGGQNRAQLALARAAYEETTANYRQTVLSAIQDVEDQLTAQSLLADQVDAERSALTAAQHTLDVANNRYKAGLVTYLEVVTAQTTELSLESTVVQLRGQQLVAAVGLVRALGGGW
jgi:multidrug efflux system outer membrane protein